MIPSSSVRRALAAAALATATAGSLLLPAAPASATPVDGSLGAYGYFRDHAGACDFTESNAGEDHQIFTPGTGPRTARTVTTFRATPSGGAVVSARGRVENETSGVAAARNRAFKNIRFTADHLVQVANPTAFDCGMGLLADSQSSADVRVRRRGRVHIEWDRGRAGQIEQIFVSRDGVPVVDRIRPNAHGELTFNVRRGRYVVFVQFVTRANERDVPVGDRLTKRAHFRVALDYRR